MEIVTKNGLSNFTKKLLKNDKELNESVKTSINGIAIEKKNVNLFSFSGTFFGINDTTNVTPNIVDNHLIVSRANSGTVQCGVLLPKLSASKTYKLTLKMSGYTTINESTAVRLRRNISSDLGSAYGNLTKDSNDVWSIEFTGLENENIGILFVAICNIGATLDVYDIKLTDTSDSSEGVYLNPDLQEYQIIYSDNQVELKNKCEYRIQGEITQCDFTMSAPEKNYSSIVSFKTSSTFTYNLTNNSGYNVKYVGEDCEGGVFNPSSGKIYTISFVFNGLCILALVVGVI